VDVTALKGSILLIFRFGPVVGNGGLAAFDIAVTLKFTFFISQLEHRVLRIIRLSSFELLLLAHVFVGCVMDCIADSTNFRFCPIDVSNVEEVTHLHDSFFLGSCSIDV
jgi:hypothetical protein